MTAGQHNCEDSPLPPLPQAELSDQDYKSMVQFINEEADPVWEQWSSTGAVSDNMGQDSLMDEMSLKFPFIPCAPCVQPFNLCVGQRAASLSLVSFEFYDHFCQNNPPPNRTNLPGLTMANLMTLKSHPPVHAP